MRPVDRFACIVRSCAGRSAADLRAVYRRLATASDAAATLRADWPTDVNTDRV